MKRTPLRRVSIKRQKELREYAKIRKEYLAAHPTCEVCGQRKATDIHHRNHRFGSRLNDVEYFLATCRVCHNDIHQRPSAARDRGLLI